MLVELPIAAVIALNTFAWLVIQLGLVWFFTRANAPQLSAKNFFARPKSWERKGRCYEKIFFVKHWKGLLPDAGRWFSGVFSKANLLAATPEYLEKFLQETWRGELVHWLALLALPLFCVWNPWWGMLVNAAYALAANAPCILVQRYNRSRLHRLLARSRRNFHQIQKL